MIPPLRCSTCPRPRFSSGALRPHPYRPRRRSGCRRVCSEVPPHCGPCARRSPRRPSAWTGGSADGAGTSNEGTAAAADEIVLSVTIPHDFAVGRPTADHRAARARTRGISRAVAGRRRSGRPVPTHAGVLGFDRVAPGVRSTREGRVEGAGRGDKVEVVNLPPRLRGQLDVAIQHRDDATVAVVATLDPASDMGVVDERVRLRITAARDGRDYFLDVPVMFVVRAVPH